MDQWTSRWSHRRYTSRMCGRWLLFIETERHGMIQIKHPIVAKSSFPVMVKAALLCVCACVCVCWRGRDSGLTSWRDYLASSTWLLLFPKWKETREPLYPRCIPYEVALAYMGKYAQHTVIPCNQKSPNKQLLLKTYIHELLLTTMHHQHSIQQMFI